MKTKILLTVSMLMFFIMNVSIRGAAQNATEKEIITIWSTPDVQGLASTIAVEYGKNHPNLEFKALPFSQPGFPENMSQAAGVAFVSQESAELIADPSLLKMVIARDVIVPVMNAENPFISRIDQQGISLQKFRQAFTAGNAAWGIFLGNEAKESLKVYIPDDEAAESAVAGFMGISTGAVTGAEAKSASEIIQLVQQNKYAVGFCRLLSLAEPGKQTLPENIKLLPIDKNESGQIEYHEKIYGSLEDFKRGVWIGKYPRALIQGVYAVSPATMPNENVADFLSWVVTGGQQFMEPAGFSELVYNERHSKLEKIHPPQIVLEPEPEQTAKTNPLLFIVLGILVVAVVAGVVYQRNRKKRKMPLGNFSRHAKILTESALSFPGGLYFDKSHTWVFMEKNGNVKFGVDDFIPNVTGDFTRVILKNPGEQVKRKEPVVTLIQKGKQIQIHAPVSGIIKEINETLVVDPFVINNSPYEDGWIYTIEPSNWLREISFFKMGESYKEWIGNEILRLKDFLACSFNIKSLTKEELAFQEGGEIITHPLKDLGPEIWEDFQNYFIDTSDMY
ncbi:MAG: hypothetical protein JW761_10540 [Prolixibacteraceae bacterium]|nr:hypothetical protein [Prolixibacteraceae bacterium]